MLILIFALLNQSTENFTFNKYEPWYQEYISTKHFIQQIEEKVPPYAMVFQLPYSIYPEPGKIYKMKARAHLKPYQFSETIRWSYGVVKGRPGDIWYKNTSSLPTEEMIKTITKIGFEGVYVDTYGYEDSGEKILFELQDILGNSFITTPNKRFYFFDLTEYKERTK